MTEILAFAGAALAIFCVAPQVVLRLLVRIYPRHADRRAELIAELPVVPRWARPFWVVEQIPLAVFEGVGERLRPRRASSRAEHPDSSETTAEDVAEKSSLSEEETVSRVPRSIKLLKQFVTIIFIAAFSSALPPNSEG